MKKGAAYAVVVLTAITPLAACTSQRNSQSTTSPSASGAQSGAEKMTTQLKTTDGTQIATATFDFANGYATVTVEAGPNQVLSQGFHGLQIHSVGKCEGDFSSAGSVFQVSGHTGYPASGDLTALQVRSDGSGKLVTTSNSFSAADLRNNSGTALILHQGVDNLSGAPAGQSSKMLACGVIAAASSTTTSSTTSTTSVTTVTTTAVAPPATTSTSTSTSTVTSAPTTTSMPGTTVTTTSLPPGS